MLPRVPDTVARPGVRASIVHARVAVAPFGVRQEARTGQVDSAVGQRADRHDRRRLTEEQPRERQQVHADVEQRARAERRVEDAMLGRLVGEEAEVGRTRPVTSPIAPLATMSWTARIVGLQRIHMASMKNTPRSTGLGHDELRRPRR